MYEPTIETMIELLGDQVDQLNFDEDLVSKNLDFIEKSVESAIISRKDTFKEQMTRAYADKQDQVDEWKNRCSLFETNERLFAECDKERKEMKKENEYLKAQI